MNGDVAKAKSYLSALSIPQARKSMGLVYLRVRRPFSVAYLA